jgi:hypothetical protein
MQMFVSWEIYNMRREKKVLKVGKCKVSGNFQSIDRDVS